MSTTNSSSTTGPAMEFLGHVTYHLHKMKPLLPTYLHLLISASFPIITAAHASLKRPPSAAPAKKTKSKKSLHDDDGDDEETSHSAESLNVSDAILFPILAGCTLTALYLIIKWLEDPAILNRILGYYFSWIGIFFCAQYLQDILYFSRSWLYPKQYSLGGLLYKIDATNNCFLAAKDDGTTTTTRSSLPGVLSKLYLPRALHSLSWKIRRIVYFDLTFIVSLRKPLSPGKNVFRVTILDLLATMVAAGIATYQNFFSHEAIPWYLTNLLGTSFCYSSLQIISPGDVGVGSLLLSLLFFYDIYMVFNTPMMVTVATKLDVPIKLLFPRPHEVLPEPVGALPGSQEMQEYLDSLAKKRTMAMLGLGDIVVPGILIAFALRFDLYRYYLKIKAKDQEQYVRVELTEDQKIEDKEERPTYSPARGSWAERFYTARKHWSPLLENKAFPKPYFKATMVGYVGGMIATLLVMQVFNHAQPALLYLVPGVLISIWGTAFWRGELGLLWLYDENEEEKAKEKLEKAAKDKNKGKADKKDEDVAKSDEAKSSTIKQSDDTSDNDASNTSTAKDETKGGLRSILSIHVCIRNEASHESSTQPKPATAVNKSQSSTAISISGTDIEHLSDSISTSSSSDLHSSTSSTPQLVSKDELNQHNNELIEKHEKTQPIAIPVPTKSDADGNQAIKRRRQG